MVYVCGVCGWMYEEADGNPKMDILPGTQFSELPNFFFCPECGAKKDMFVPEH